MSIGDVTISQSNPDLVWVGTGESNNRQSTSWGDGVYKSTDGGKTYTNMGLRASRHIHRIVIDPRNNDVVLVAATGSLWGPGGDRGVYKTTDGGRTWKQVLKVDDDTGANDLVMDPTNSQVLWASTYQRRRTACCMNGGGPGSGIWKSTDGGETWTRLKGGVLDGPLGRIGIDVYRKRPNILYALIEGPAPAGRRRGGRRRRRGGGGRGAGRGALRRRAAAPQEAPGGRGAGGGGPPNAAPTGHVSLRRWRGDVAEGEQRQPAPDVLQQGADRSERPRSGLSRRRRPPPDDRRWQDHQHRRGVARRTPTTTRSGSIRRTPTTSSSATTAAWRVSVRHVEDVEFPAQPAGRALLPRQLRHGDARSTCAAACRTTTAGADRAQVRATAGIGNHHWATVQGGDGFVVLQDPTDSRIIFSESQDGNIVRVDRVTFESMSIRPVPGPGEPPLRWHWDTPLVALAARREGAVCGRQQGVSIARPRAVVGRR